MNTTKEIAKFLKENDNFILIPHRSPDGDCLGSVSALLLALRTMGKNAKVKLPTPVTPRLEFIWDESYEQGDFECEIAVSVDVAATYMMLDVCDEVFLKANKTVCIDHHGTNEGFADLNCINPTASATGEIIHAIIKDMGVEMNPEIAKRLFVAIADDTGGFQYSNTTSHTHKIVASLYEQKIDSDEIMRLLFATHSMEEMNLLKFVTARMQYHFGGKVCTTYVDSESLEKSGAQMHSADAWIGLTRSGQGVEVGLMFKVIGEKETRVSLRSNRYVDVSSVAKKFGGGGHVRASGVTLEEDLQTSMKLLLDELEKLV
ncbi:MAG: bifunctional oligoribonuclease/PAP phosphatase NrnA [Clostridia bacterium]|nr:bifunctional oligoribonuclease/PAP phosphatase NrnA [Clostridia bacterium]